MKKNCLAHLVRPKSAKIRFLKKQNIFSRFLSVLPPPFIPLRHPPILSSTDTNTDRSEDMKNPYYTFLTPDNFYATTADIDPHLLNESMKSFRSESRDFTEAIVRHQALLIRQQGVRGMARKIKTATGEGYYYHPASSTISGYPKKQRY